MGTPSKRHLAAAALLFLAALAAAPAALHAAPVACYTVACSGLTCDFDATCAQTEGSDYTWIWGDGKNEQTSEKTIRHTYANGGIFTVRLTVGFDRVGFDSKTRMVTVAEAGS